MKLARILIYTYTMARHGMIRAKNLRYKWALSDAQKQLDKFQNFLWRKQAELPDQRTISYQKLHIESGK